MWGDKGSRGAPRALSLGAHRLRSGPKEQRPLALGRLVDAEHSLDHRAAEGGADGKGSAVGNKIGEGGELAVEDEGDDIARRFVQDLFGAGRTVADNSDRGCLLQNQALKIGR